MLSVRDAAINTNAFNSMQIFTEEFKTDTKFAQLAHPNSNPERDILVEQ